jgi:hypothetical protein
MLFVQYAVETVSHGSSIANLLPGQTATPVLLFVAVALAIYFVMRHLFYRWRPASDSLNNLSPQKTAEGWGSIWPVSLALQQALRCALYDVSPECHVASDEVNYQLPIPRRRRPSGFRMRQSRAA